MYIKNNNIHYLVCSVLKFGDDGGLQSAEEELECYGTLEQISEGLLIFLAAEHGRGCDVAGERGNEVGQLLSVVQPTEILESELGILAARGNTVALPLAVHRAVQEVQTDFFLAEGLLALAARVSLLQIVHLHEVQRNLQLVHDCAGAANELGHVVAVADDPRPVLDLIQIQTVVVQLIDHVIADKAVLGKGLPSITCVLIRTARMVDEGCTAVAVEQLRAHDGLFELVVAVHLLLFVLDIAILVLVHEALQLSLQRHEQELVVPLVLAGDVCVSNILHPEFVHRHESQITRLGNRHS